MATSGGLQYSAQKANIRAEGDRMNLITFITSFVITGGAIVLQGAMQTNLDAIVQLSSFDIILVYIPFFFACLFVSVALSYQISLHKTGNPSIITNSWIKPSTSYITANLLCAVFQAGAQSAFSISIISRFKDESDGRLTGIIIVSTCLVIGTVFITSATMLFWQRSAKLPFSPFASDIAPTIPLTANAFATATLLAANELDQEVSELFEGGK